MKILVWGLTVLVGVYWIALLILAYAILWCLCQLFQPLEHE